MRRHEPGGHVQHVGDLVPVVKTRNVYVAFVHNARRILPVYLKRVGLHPAGQAKRQSKAGESLFHAENDAAIVGIVGLF